MTFTEKLKCLTNDRFKNRMAKKAGLPTTAISDYIAKGSVPGINRALALAHVFGVSLEWLVDDKQEWPPVRVASTQIVEQYVDQAIAA